MADCPFCREIGNHFITTNIPDKGIVETEIVKMGCDAHLHIRFHRNGERRSEDLRVGLGINYCPMCGRGLNDG